MAVAWHLAGNRSRTAAPGRVTWHSLSFGGHYDPGNVAFGALMAHNDEHLEPGSGYRRHAHADVEIVTWVLSGVLAHRDSRGGASDLAAGMVQVQSAGAGIRHTEIADVGAGPTRFVQAWVRPDAAGTVPQRSVTTLELGAGLVPLVSGSRSAPLRLGAAGATLWGAQLEAGEEIGLPEDARQHLFVVSGGLDVAGLAARAGDAVRIIDEPGHRAVASAPALVQMWTFARGPGRPG